MSEQVEYRDVPDFPGYRAGSDGSVWTHFVHGSQQVSHWRQIKISNKGPCNYGHVFVRTPGQRKQQEVHKLILWAFVGPAPPGMECRHLDGNGANNRLSNLAWGTKKENGADRVLHGTSNRGSKHPLAELTESQVIEIRERYASGEFQSELARAFGVSRTEISSIVTGRIWSHIGGPRTTAGFGGPRRIPGLADRYAYRDEQVARLLVEGCSYRQIGARLGIKRSTVIRSVARLRCKQAAT